MFRGKRRARPSTAARVTPGRFWRPEQGAGRGDGCLAGEAAELVQIVVAIYGWLAGAGGTIVTTVTLSGMSEADAAMGVLSSQLTPEVGRINRVRTEPTLVIGDFAPKVVTMVRAARAVDEAGWSVDLRRTEKLLSASATDTAALHFVSRIEEIRARVGK